MSATLAIVPAVRPAEVSALAAALGVRELPPALHALAHPQAGVRIDVRAVELAAAHLLYRDADPALLARIVGTLAPASYRIYGLEMTEWSTYAAADGRPAVPADADLLARWVLELADAGRSYRRIRRKIAAVGAVHSMLGMKAPTADRLVRKAFAYVAQEYGRRADRQALPFRPTELRAALVYLESMAQRTPERAALILALLALGIATGLRRAELVALNTDDIEVLARGIRVRVRKTKTRRESDPPAYIDVARVPDMRICPVVALTRYAQLCRLTAGPLFRGVLPDGSLRRTRLHADSVRMFLREVVDRAAIGDATQYGAHSLRAGFVTAAYEAGVGIDDIMRVSLHTDPDQAYAYVRPAPFSRPTTQAVFG